MTTVCGTAGAYQASLKVILAAEHELQQSYSLHAPSTLKSGDVIVHNMVKKFGESETRALCNIMRLTNAHHVVRRHEYNQPVVRAGTRELFSTVQESASLGVVSLV